MTAYPDHQSLIAELNHCKTKPELLASAAYQKHRAYLTELLTTPRVFPALNTQPSIKDFLRALENLPSIAGSTSGDRAAQTLLEKRTGLTTLLPSLSDEPITLAGPTDASLCLTGLDLLPVSTELLPLPSDIEAGDDDFEAGPSDTLPALPSFCEAEPLDLQKTMQLSAAELQVLADHSRIVADLVPSLAADEAVTIRQAAATHAEVDLRSTLILSTAAAASEHVGRAGVVCARAPCGKPEFLFRRSCHLDRQKLWGPTQAAPGRRVSR